MQSQTREKNDPHELNNPIPYSVSAVILGLTIWSVAYIFWTSHTLEKNAELEQLASVTRTTSTEPAAPPANTTTLVAKKSSKAVNGKAIYSASCSSCHQATGKGLAGVFPPLDASSWVSSDDHNLPVQIIAKGLKGKINVAGTDYNGIMPAFAGSLSNEELAAVITYIRGAWSNKSSKVTTADVELSLTQFNSQTQPWDGEAQLIKSIGKP